MFEDKSRLWVIHISDDEACAQRAQKEGFICIGWHQLGDLSRYNTREEMKAAYRKAIPNASEGSVRASYGQVFRFAHEMQIGDPVVYPIKGSRELLIGEITGPYEWVQDDEQLIAAGDVNLRRVKWLKRVPRIAFSQSALHSFGSFTTLTSSDDHLEEVIAVLRGETVANAKGGADPGQQGEDEEEESEVSLEEDVTSLADRAKEETEDYLLRQWSGTKQAFEEVVAAVFRAMNYTATTQRGTHDLGVDVIAHPDPLGVHPPYLKIQAKSGTSTAGAPAVKQLRGLLNPGEKGIMVSLGGFSNDARHVEQNDASVILIDGPRFVGLFLDHYENLSPEIRHRYPLTRVYAAAP